MKKLIKALSDSLAISFLPKGMKNQIKIQLKQNLKIDEAYCKLVNKIGSYEAGKLMTQFNNEAFAGKEVNSDYMIRKLNEEHEKTIF